MLEPIDPDDLEGCCRKLIETYGPAARHEVRARRNRHLEHDDIEGFLVWWRIEHAMAQLLGDNAR